PPFVPERLCHREAGETDAQTVARRFVHLAKYHRDLGFREIIELDDLRLDHFVIKVVALARPFAHACENGLAAVLGGDIIDQLEHGNGLAHTGTTEETDLASLRERADEVDYFDARFEQIDRRRQFREFGRWLMNRAACLR